MSNEQFVALGHRLFGDQPGWQRRFGQALGVSQDSVAQVARGRPVPKTWERALRQLEGPERAARAVPPPPPGVTGQEAEGAAQRALWPLLDGLCSEAEASGWTRREIERAVLAWGAVRTLRLG